MRLTRRGGALKMDLHGNAAFSHKPVLLEPALRYLAPKPGGVYVDATVGGAGHSEQIASRIAPDGLLIGIDQDETALAAAAERLRRFGSLVHLVHDNFAHLGAVLDRLGIDGIDGILFDFGVSSPQLDRAERGFSYHQDAPLDMRMDRTQKTYAAQLVNTLSEAELARILRQYGEERWAGRIAGHIVRARQEARIETTGELVEIVKAAIPAAARRQGPHPARRTFQALRIAVNRELDVIEEALPQAIHVLRHGGRLVAISFHSLEDRIVKQTLQRAANPCVCPPDFPVCQCGQVPSVRLLTRRAVVATEEETLENPRARSAKLRAAERVLLPGEGE